MRHGVESERVHAGLVSLGHAHLASASASANSVADDTLARSCWSRVGGWAASEAVIEGEDVAEDGGGSNDGDDEGEGKGELRSENMS